MKVALVHNPNAGAAGQKTADLMRLLRDAGHRAVSLEPSKHLLQERALEDVEMVVVAGGDGTLRKVALQFAGSSLPLAPLPMGTANNVGKSLGVKGTPEEIVAGWSAARRKVLDLGRARGPWGERLFLEGIGFGLVGRSIAIIEEVDEATEREFNDREDKLQRDLSVFLALAREMPATPMRCVIDGQDSSGAFLLLEVLNIRHAGPRLELASNADPGDGWLDVVVATDENRADLITALKCALNSHPTGPLLPARRARQIQIELRSGELRIDDEVVLDPTFFARKNGAPAAIEIEIVPQALTVVLPG